MSLLPWVAAGYAAGCLPLERVAGRLGACAKTALPVLLALRVSGPYAGGASAVAALAGSYWPALRRGDDAAATAFATLLPLMPVEVAGGSILSALAWRLTRRGAIAGVALVPALATLRAQPTPLRIAAAGLALMTVVRRVESRRAASVAASP